MIFHSCPIIFLALNPAECHSPIALFYAGEKIDLESFDPRLYSSEERLKRMVDNPLAVVEYFHSMVTIIIEKVLKGGRGPRCYFRSQPFGVAGISEPSICQRIA